MGGDARLARTAAHPFYTRLNQILDKADFDGSLASAILALAVAANVSARQAASHKVFPRRPIPSEQWIEVSGEEDPDK